MDYFLCVLGMVFVLEGLPYFHDFVGDVVAQLEEELGGR